MKSVRLTSSKGNEVNVLLRSRNMLVSHFMFQQISYAHTPSKNRRWERGYLCLMTQPAPYLDSRAFQVEQNYLDFIPLPRPPCYHFFPFSLFGRGVRIHGL